MEKYTKFQILCSQRFECWSKVPFSSSAERQLDQQSIAVYIERKLL